ncbi:hypothetical protein [Limosilactobacillus fermentum]|uniref:hypothetical protein n=1 Tax=Limosilactobacillus fermentum TaxID=1613 RepID=UPI001E29C42A|nr:hypothetical protein [Limosilactobacillus fermentum]MCD5422978.1 hypothetical protein [Limosilactobacillus fermentum]
MAKGFRIYNGRDFQKVGGGNVKIWNGHDWEHGKARSWDGHNWINLLEERHVTTWDATWTQGYWSEWHGHEAKGHQGYLLWDGNYLLEGSYGPYYDHWDWGNESGMIGFDDGSIRRELSGARIEKVELFLYEVHAGYYAGGQAVIGAHNSRGWQSHFHEINHGIARQRFYGRGNGQWITLPNWVGDNFRDNKLSGLTTYADGTSLWQYLVFAGTNQGWKKPKLRITYWN